MDRKGSLERLMIGLIGVWIALVVLVFLVTKSKEGHRERIVEVMHQAQEHVRLFISTAPDMIFFQRADGSITDRNQAVSQLTGQPDQAFEGNSGLWMEMLHPDDRSAVENLLRQPPYKRDCYEMSYRLKTVDGDWLWIDSKRVVVTDDDGNFVGYNCIDRDVTEQKLNAKALMVTTRKLEERVKEQQCLYGVCLVARDISLSLDDAMIKIVTLVEDAFQYPEITRARIVLESGVYLREDFKPTQWKLVEDVMVAGNKAGTLEVYYLEERPDTGEGPFLEEELLLVDSVAAKIGAHLSRRHSEAEIQRSFQFLTSIMDSLTYPFLVLDANDYTIKTANASSGANISEGQVLTCYELTHHQDKPCSSKSHPCPIEQVKATGQPAVVEHLHVGDDGVERCHEVHAYPIFDEHGEVVQIIEYFMDITDRKVTESKLGELAAFPAYNPNIVMSINIDGDVLYMNAATADALRRMGLSPKNADHCLPPNIKHIIAQCARSDRGVVNHVSELNERTWTWSFHPVEGQNIIHCYATDITDHVKQEKEVRLLSAAVNQSSNMVCITDTGGTVEYVNPYFSEVTGYSFLDIVGKPINVLKSGEHDEQFYDDMWDTIQAGETWTGNIRNRRMNGELYWERKTITPIHNEAGEIVSYLSVSNDITTELATQRKLIEADKLSAIGTLAAGVAHEFKNYLGGIIGNASYAMELLKGKDGMKVVSEALPKIIDMGERANDVAMSLLTYSRSRPEDRQPEDLAKIIRKSVKLVEKEMRIQSIELVTHFEDVPPVEVSASKIQQLLLNLLINSQHAIKSHGVITIALFNHDREIEIRVGDTGIGIPHDILEKIFDPFFSTKGVWGKDEVIGTGIGLSICRNIAREHGGELTVDSIVGMGTTFTLTLPVTPPDGQISPFGRPRDDGLDVMIFSLDKSIISRYYP
ncbi:MAG: PAS domain S-box protein, partial [Candidatus Zixiibacteriota bacterium]